MRNFHENYKGVEIFPVPSDRLFGLTLSGVLIVLGILKTAFWGWLFGSLFLTLGVVILCLTFFYPGPLSKIKNIFLKVAPAIARYLNPVLMGIVYAICFVPGGYIMRLLRHDPLKRAFDPYALTYWTKREDHDLPEPMKYQF